MRRPLILEPRLALVFAADLLKVHYPDTYPLTEKLIGERIERAPSSVQSNRWKLLRLARNYWQSEVHIEGPLKFDTKTVPRIVEQMYLTWDDFWELPEWHQQATPVDLEEEIERLKKQVSPLTSDLQEARARLRAVRAAVGGSLKLPKDQCKEVLDAQDHSG